MYILLGYCLVLHVLSLIVLQIRYSWFKGGISAPDVNRKAIPVQESVIAPSKDTRVSI